ncbi:hypothetical protein MRB53_036361 [Persea americana]|nr:hypothetical protein MRB53_036673 [Persea americana]KAJ8614712.1 hypothetical protein MRB53_036378 [Persea americana]KAJ8614948.1 hypothetical protein MRB53_036361 [Persea americana]
MLLNQGIQKQSREQIQDQIDVFPDVVSLLIAIRSLLLSSCPFLLNDRFKCNYGGKAGLTAIDSFAPTEEAPAYAGLSTGAGFGSPSYGSRTYSSNLASTLEQERFQPSLERRDTFSSTTGGAVPIGTLARSTTIVPAFPGSDETAIPATDAFTRSTGSLASSIT